MKKRAISILTITAIALTLILTLSSSFALAQEVVEEKPSVPLQLKILDLIIVRPLCVAVASGSTALYIATSPLTYLMGVSVPSARILVEAPWRFTGARYLGEFNHYKDEKPITVIYEGP